MFVDLTSGSHLEHDPLIPVYDSNISLTPNDFSLIIRLDTVMSIVYWKAGNFCSSHYNSNCRFTDTVLSKIYKWIPFVEWAFFSQNRLHSWIGNIQWFTEQLSSKNSISSNKLTLQVFFLQLWVIAVSLYTCDVQILFSIWKRALLFVISCHR